MYPYPNSLIMKKKEIAILLATYNGERFLREQLDSLMSQSYKDWTLYVQDDLSTDATLAIIHEYQKRYGNIVLLQNDKKLKAKNNFASMLQQVEADYYFFCDQDDVWLTDKVKHTLQVMFDCEAANVGLPVIVHTDLKVVDSELTTIADSFWDYTCVSPNKLNSFNKLCVRYLVTGCTMLLNRAVRDISVPIPENACMHDVWCVLSTVKNGGILKSLDEVTILYRQHSNNVLGASDAHSNWLRNKLGHLKSVWKENRQTYRMLQELQYGSWVKYLYYKAYTLIQSRF